MRDTALTVAPGVGQVCPTYPLAKADPTHYNAPMGASPTPHANSPGQQRAQNASPIPLRSSPLTNPGTNQMQSTEKWGASPVAQSAYRMMWTYHIPQIAAIGYRAT